MQRAAPFTNFESSLTVLRETWLTSHKGEVMSHTVKFGEGEVEQRLAALEKYLTELQLHRDSRRGLEGVRGEKGESGATGAVGAQGLPGRDADISTVIDAALKRVREEFDAEYKVLSEVVRHELKTSGVIDESGNAILIPGPVGPVSEIQGPKGDRGDRGERGEQGSQGESG